MLMTDVTHSAVEWRPAQSEDAELWGLSDAKKRGSTPL